MTIKEFCQKHNIRVTDFAKIVDMGQSYIFSIQNKTNLNVTTSNANKIYFRTKERLGEGLRIEEYSNLYKE